MSEDRYTHPTDGGDPRERDEEFTESEEMARVQSERQVTHPQTADGAQGTSADAPGTNPADRHRPEADDGDGTVGP
jgi:hypothetical protein